MHISNIRVIFVKSNGYNMLLAEDELSELSVVLRRWILAEREPIIGMKKGCFDDLHSNVLI